MKTNTVLLLAVLFLAFISCEKDSKKRPVACFTTDTVNPIEGDTVLFSNCSTDAEFFFWMFGDGSTSNSESPGHIYSTPGQFLVSLWAFNSSQDTSFQTSTITVEEDNTVHEGQVVFWTDGEPPWDLQNWDIPQISIILYSVPNDYPANGTITGFHATEPECGAQGALTLTLPADQSFGVQFIDPNTYFVKETSVTINEGECMKVKVE